MTLRQKVHVNKDAYFYHLILVRILFILTQENRDYDSYYLLNRSEFEYYFNKIESRSTEAVKYLWACQTKERVNPHSQFCAYNSRFRPS